jgi:DNA replicative helicase MCM subunit Mcm2 (Cdc46/Mcm family)
MYTHNPQTNQCCKYIRKNTSFASNHIFTFFTFELVKAGLALALFGGSQKYADDKNRIPIRGDPHILVVGDPGLGKSQMLQVEDQLFNI